MFRQLLAVVLCLTVLVGPASAQQGNFSVSPAPIPYPYFQPARKDTKLGLSFISITGDSLTLVGAGATMMGRKATDERRATSGMGGLMLFGGDMDFSGAGGGTGSLFMMNVPLMMNVEFQTYKTWDKSFIIFLGPQLSTGLGGFTMEAPGFSMSMLQMPFLFGGQIGAQGGMLVGGGKVRIAPFAMMSLIGGSVLTSQTTTIDTGFGSFSSSGSDSVSVPFTTQFSFGADIIYRPMGLSIGTILQMMAASGDNNGYSTLLLQAGWHFGGYDRSDSATGAPAELNAGETAPASDGMMKKVMTAPLKKSTTEPAAAPAAPEAPQKKTIRDE